MKTVFKKIITSIIQYEAKLVLKKYKPRIVAVVGSVGKTSVKDAIYTALSSKFHVRKSEKSFNSEIGIPLTILGCQSGWSNPFVWIKNIFDGIVLLFLKNNFPEWLVLEVGADAPGDIQSVAKWLKTDVVVLTRLPDVPVHVENFDSPEQVVEEKLSIVSSLKEDGVIVMNGDDKKITAIKKDNSDKKIITFGLSKANDLSASHCAISYHKKAPIGMHFRMSHGDSTIPLEIIGSLGKHHIYPVLAATATASLFNIDLNTVAKEFIKHKSPPGRMRILKGLKGSVVIDDTYNSSPVAVKEALSTLGDIKTDGKKIAVLGDMLELGQYSIEEHKKVGKQVASICDELITVGPRARDIAEGALSNGMSESKVLQYDDVTRAGKELEIRLKDHDVVLMKASQGVRMEKAVVEIIADPDKQSELLVRQDEVWLKK